MQNLHAKNCFETAEDGRPANTAERTSGADLPAVTAAFRSGVTDPRQRAPHTAPGRLGTLLHQALERAQDKRERGSPGQELWAHTAYGRRQWPREAPQTPVSGADSAWCICVTASLPPQTDTLGHARL